MQEDTTLVSWANSIGKISGLIGGLSLASSLIYDWGFFRAANLTFLDIPSSLSDHVRSSLVWLPKAVLVVSAIFIVELFLKRVEHGMTEKEIIDSSKNPEKTRKIRVSPKYIIIPIIFLALIAYLLLGEYFIRDIQSPLIILWFIFSVWANSHPRILKRRPAPIRFAIHWLPPIAIWLAFSGYNDCTALINSSPQQVVYYKSEPQKGVDVNILRHVERGLLLNDKKTNHVAFVQWSEVVKIERLQKKSYFRGLLSRFVPSLNKIYDELEKKNSIDKK